MTQRKAKYIVLEGTDGAGKSTYAQMLTEYLSSKGKRVLQTREPGTPLSPLTMQLRAIMLDEQYSDQLTVVSRELISQAIRSIHLEKVIAPALTEYDYIIQDRGALSGYAYGLVCGVPFKLLDQVIDGVFGKVGHTFSLYDKVVYLKTDPVKGLQRARSVQPEFESGDAIENKGEVFITEVAAHMDNLVNRFSHCTIEVDNKSIDEVFKEILQNLGEE